MDPLSETYVQAVRVFWVPAKNLSDCLLTYVKTIILQNEKDRNIPSIDKFINVLMKNSYLFNDKLSFKFEKLLN